VGNKIYVGNFPWSTTEDELKTLFGAYGALRSVKIIMDRETGRSRGFAFIEFEEASAAQDAIEQEDGRDLNGREMKVRMAEDRAPRRDGDRPYRSNSDERREGMQRELAREPTPREPTRCEDERGGGNRRRRRDSAERFQD
jgi:RNA recognition motif-containing protein